MSDEARRRILERRAKFVAAALGAVAAAANCAKPEPCLSAVANEKTPPKPAPEDASVPDVKDNVHPAACLSEAPHPAPDAPPPMPCLKIAMPRDAGIAKPVPCLEIDPTK